MSKMYVYLFCSRNKDNKNIENFKQRFHSILEYEENEDKVFEEFERFAERGVSGERSRFYKSVNARDEEKVREALLVKLIKDKPSMTALNRVLISVAEATENKAESKWMFDFDVDDEALADEFIEDIRKYSTVYWDKEQAEVAMKNEVWKYRTPHGYAIVVAHGFDTRELMEKWKKYDITLKRDDMLFQKMIVKE